jgi:small-conductance mechanosensitive channel
MIQFPKPLRIYLILLLVALVVSGLTSCGTVEPTSAPATDTPKPTAATVEPEAGEGAEVFLLPSPTPAPTVTPGAAAELVSQFTQATGLEEVSIFRVSVENWLNLGLSILQAFVIGFLLSNLVYFVLTKIVARTETKYDDLLVERIRLQIFTILIVLGFQVGTVRLPFIDVLVKQWLNRIYTIIYVLAITVILWRVVDLLVEWYKHEVEPKRADPHQVDTILLLLHRFARLLLITIAAITLLSIYNINVNALIAALGIGGLAVSLAAQDTLSNVISGIMIMMDQPFRVGDRIEIPKLNTWGDVVDIGLRSTRIRTADNRLVIIPNNVISTDQVVNYTYPDPRYRIQIEIAIGYEQDTEQVRQILVDTVSQVGGVISYKPVEALVVDMGEYAITFRVRWWIQSYVDTRRMFDRVYTALREALDEAGIKMPYDIYHIDISNMPGDRNDDIQNDEITP